MCAVIAITIRCGNWKWDWRGEHQGKPAEFMEAPSESAALKRPHPDEDVSIREATATTESFALDCWRSLDEGK